MYSADGIQPSLIQSVGTWLRYAMGTCATVKKGSTARGFSGHGSEALLGMIEALRIFAEAGTGTFEEQYPDICPEFTELYRDCTQELKERVEKDEVCGRWGEDYTEEAKEVLRIIEG